VILIGEIRDRETMQHALAYAETGHLCLSTLHANNADQTLNHADSRNDLGLNIRLSREQTAHDTPQDWEIRPHA
jgi:Tfp pilus assembly ATPase PilU